MTVEAERLATHSTEWVLPFFWVAGGTVEKQCQELHISPRKLKVGKRNCYRPGKRLLLRKVAVIEGKYIIDELFVAGDAGVSRSSPLSG